MFPIPGARLRSWLGEEVRASATETDVTGAAALARGGWLAKCYVPTYQEGKRASLKIATYQKENLNFVGGKLLHNNPTSVIIIILYASHRGLPYPFLLAT